MTRPGPKAEQNSVVALRLRVTQRIAIPAEGQRNGNTLRRLMAVVACAAGLAYGGLVRAGAPDSRLPPHFRVQRFISSSEIRIADDDRAYVVRRGQPYRQWTFMGISTGRDQYAIFEDFQNVNGHIVFVDAKGTRITFSKTAESDIGNGNRLYQQHSYQQLANSADDVLGATALARGGDPTYATVQGVLPKNGIAPVDLGRDSATHSNLLEAFVGTPDTGDKVYFMWGGRSPNFDPVVFQPSIEVARRTGTFLQGLVGDYLPAVRFVYPDSGGAWTELVAFAPFREEDGNQEIQPVWYRVSRIRNGKLEWVRYVDSYRQFPIRSDGSGGIEDGGRFFRDLLQFRQRWAWLLNKGMSIKVPDQRMGNMARFALICSMMTRAGDFPRYGIAEGNYSGYGANEHFGFPDTFTAQTGALVDWGLLNVAGRYIDNYLGKFVLDDGSILYRGPEVGQYGRMLAVLAKYLQAGGDPEVLVRNRRKVEAIVGVLRRLRAEAMKRSIEDPSYGMLSGWSEADSSLLSDPGRYMRPYFSNSTQAERGFTEFGEAWRALGVKRGDAQMISLGETLDREAAGLKRNINESIARSTLTVDGGHYLPSMAGARTLPDVAIARDEWDPQWQYFRVYMEMLRSGVLSDAQIALIYGYLRHHHGLVLGMPSSFDRGQYESYGFLADGYGYSLIQTNHIRDALLMLYSEMANQYTRGTWIAQEERDPLAAGFRGPWMGYSVVAELTVASMVRWLVVFEDPRSNSLWLAKGAPESWLRDGKSIAVDNASTRWGRVAFSIDSHTSAGRIDARVVFPDAGIRAETRLRLRTGSGFLVKSVTVNGKPWNQFDPADNVIILPPGTSGNINIVARNK